MTSLAASGKDAQIGYKNSDVIIRSMATNETYAAIQRSKGLLRLRIVVDEELGYTALVIGSGQPFVFDETKLEELAISKNACGTLENVNNSDALTPEEWVPLANYIWKETYVPAGKELRTQWKLRACVRDLHRFSSHLEMRRRYIRAGTITPTLLSKTLREFDEKNVQATKTRQNAMRNSGYNQNQIDFVEYDARRIRDTRFGESELTGLLEALDVLAN